MSNQRRVSNNRYNGSSKRLNELDRRLIKVEKKLGINSNINENFNNQTTNELPKEIKSNLIIKVGKFIMYWFFFSVILLSIWCSQIDCQFDVFTFSIPLITFIGAIHTARDPFIFKTDTFAELCYSYMFTVASVVGLYAAVLFCTSLSIKNLPLKFLYSLNPVLLTSTSLIWTYVKINKFSDFKDIQMCTYVQIITQSSLIFLSILGYFIQFRGSNGKITFASSLFLVVLFLFSLLYLYAQYKTASIKISSDTSNLNQET